MLIEARGYAYTVTTTPLEIVAAVDITVGTRQIRINATDARRLSVALQGAAMDASHAASDAEIEAEQIEPEAAWVT